MEHDELPGMRLEPVGEVVGSYDPRDGQWVAGRFDGCCGGAAACAVEPTVKCEHAGGSAGQRWQSTHQMQVHGTARHRERHRGALDVHM